ncbi:hypothetical protein EDS67_09885 [candidate division KSB1 bacterium]|nr:MAG: hypothetical protein EDS67_09885 [candidate division KSB1 bacterium]MCE7941591.1 hypothetical protein [Chlorobi bacterium CHB1]MDL1875508.1 hypothetical protein [Cytophagia bacterium CHB2]
MKATTQERQCEFNHFKRARYFHGMLLSDRDFRDEQSYHREKRKLANKMLHGWGIVCGLELEWEKDKKWITVTPGMALDCHGNEIMVCDPFKLDLDALLCPPQPAAPLQDPCQEVKAGSKTYYLTIGYEERMVDPVSVYAPGGGCEEKTCEHSRWQEGFCLQLESNIPASPRIHPIETSLHERVIKAATDKKKEAVAEFMNGEFCHLAPPCPACCPEVHHLILGTVVIEESAGKKTVKEITLPDRRYVLTPGMMQYLFLSLFDGAANYQTVFGHLEKFWAAAKQANQSNCLISLLTNPIAALCGIKDQIANQYDEKNGDRGKKDEGVSQALEATVEKPAAEALGAETEVTAAEAPNGDKAKKAKGGKK